MQVELLLKNVHVKVNILHQDAHSVFVFACRDLFGGLAFDNLDRERFPLLVVVVAVFDQQLIFGFEIWAKSSLVVVFVDGADL